MSTTEHCGSKPKKIAIGIAPLGIVSIGIVPMGIVSIGIVPMGIVSIGVVAMGVLNASVVGMGVISAGITTMGVWEWTPGRGNHAHHSKVHSEKKLMLENTQAFKTKSQADLAAKKIGCEGSHRMGNRWMPCKHH